LAAILLAAAGNGWKVAAATIWDGPVLSFSKPDGADWTREAYQDRLTPDVWLTRASNRGLFNIARETAYTQASSPVETEWAFGSLADYASLTFTNWEAWNGRRPPDMVGREAVMRLVSEDVYLAIRFTSWGVASGGFSYERSTPAVVPEASATVLLGAGLALRGLYAFGRLGIAGAKGK
jgi:hypothetical protein